MAGTRHTSDGNIAQCLKQNRAECSSKLVVVQFGAPTLVPSLAEVNS